MKYRLDYPMIAKRVKEARDAAHLTQAELAEQIDISTNSVAQLETNRMKTSLWTLVNIANAFHLDINYFLCEDSNQADEIDKLDLALNSRLQSLSNRDKAFLIHVIDGLKLYQGEEPPQV